MFGGKGRPAGVSQHWRLVRTNTPTHPWQQCYPRDCIAAFPPQCPLKGQEKFFSGWWVAISLGTTVLGVSLTDCNGTYF